MVTHGNYTIVGGTVELFAACVAAMHARGILWSSACDKKGDWACSTKDDTPLAVVREVCDLIDREQMSVAIYKAGELTFMIEDIATDDCLQNAEVPRA